jgi:adenosylmethionine-8-amino-7-oxononanoate aminotransferase
VDGRQGDHTILAPPYNVTPAQIDEITEKLSMALEAALR